MRTYDELLTAALETGTFADYIGDGFSVPWEVALPLSIPLGLTMWGYKAYLDAHWPDGAKLHDWCYTPYGALINVTRAEADLALHEYIARDSVFHASIVYAAVVAGGEPFFGTSQTGYHGIQAPGTIRNMPLASVDEIGVSAMPTKCVLLINGTTVRSGPIPSLGFTGQEHQFGCSESFWNDLTIGNALRTKLQTLADKRASVLPSQCQLLGWRLYNDGSGASTFIPLGQSGVLGTLNTANDALMIGTQVTSAAVNRRFWMHCVSDEVVSNGEFRPSFVAQAVLASYLQELGQVGQWRSETRNGYTRIQEIDASGKVTFAVNHPFNVGDQITISRAYSSTLQRFISGKFRVGSLGPLGTNLNLSNWGGFITRNGAAWIPSFTFRLLGGGQGLYVVRAGTRRVGRPFDQYHGRTSKRRKAQ